MSENKKQTTVEWLWEQMPEDYKATRLSFDVFEQAKAMEKEQIEKAYSNGRVDEQFRGAPASFYRTKAEDYYNETYKNTNE